MEKETPDSEHGQAAQMVHLKRTKMSVAIKDKKNRPEAGGNQNLDKKL